ncbi:LacI family DNA-binding transcriptional regulator [Thermoflexus sp.]|uniref:LacI family DNA-binding transcriptional regulator n=1 Tax=Thermoflexus sp. TaxID=1969742 RepID=UPI0025D4B7B8|nr:LacI family DNA-binding transcriptional regulator [Thermoflexus sp.]MDW8179957.1 LacI family DNA-binding transcriptional regulator [Anaerolineae bacterium]MCS6962534.1 LacI family transcriptional regulator [Thermoflexus sp.]MCS7350506.1 LacI family transcriptional regulator [Thermoflexus sp.]MCX7690321.1 LacI family transcriptional regulator [Thermoflexus sp.]MDW8183627.1 LacI family DNA-binding transcriptional regulator [Anaerolineae bacterium]
MPRRGSRDVTIQDVARRAGVSVATVSYVINGGPRPVAPETRERVLRAMEELDYHPNASARRLAFQRSECLGLVLAGLGDSNFATPYFLEYVRGISYAAEMKGYNVMLFTAPHRLDPPSWRRMLRSGLVDGLLLLGSSIPDEWILDLWAREFPAVLIARRIPGHTGYCVFQDYEQSAYMATRHLMERGYRRIGFLGQALRFSYGQERLRGYQRALQEVGLPYDPALVSIPERPRDDPSMEEVARLLQADPPPDALLTDRDVVVLALLRNLGLRVPEDIALVSLDESEAAALQEVPLTAVRPPKFELGMQAVEMVLRLIAGEKPQPSEVVLPMPLIVRASSPPKPVPEGSP